MGNDTFSIPEVLVIIVIVGTISLLLGLKMAENMHQRDAIKAGVAEWVINNDTGRTKFQYIKIQ